MRSEGWLVLAGVPVANGKKSYRLIVPTIYLPTEIRHRSAFNRDRRALDLYQNLLSFRISGGGWYRDIDVLISLIENGDKFWTVDMEGKSVWIVVRSRNGRKYLKTENDGVEPNNLLALPHCP
ncbi:MAG: DUF3892 domain-containing protein [Hydrogenophaga sp.]|nr:DUF3892 domain-containing protein [Hydrogenophaga sp.]